MSRLDLAGNPAEFVERYELGPARNGSTVEREASAADSRTLLPAST